MAYIVDGNPGWITVVETKAFRERAKSCMSEEEIGSAVAMIASDPTCGDLIRGTGGLRKVRYRLGGRGKRGGARIIYYFCTPDMPVFLLAVFAKNEKVDLSERERKKLAQLARAIRASYRSSQEDEDV